MGAHNLLTARFVSTVSEPGKYPDGGGLYLLVRKRGDVVERLWLFRYRRGQRGAVKETALSLGPARDVTLASAREKAGRCRSALHDGRDPRSAIEEKQAPTFGEYADTLIDEIESGFKNLKHRDQWRMTLGDAYCRAIRPKPVNAITTEDVLGILRPVWLSKSETASRIRGRIERVLDAAKANGFREGENPARWRGHLDKLLPKRKKLTRGHHAAMHYRDVPEFMVRLRDVGSVSALALEWTILTAARTGETVGADMKEVNQAECVWTIPGKRMKAGKEHRVPLTERCMEILKTVSALESKWLFPSTKRGKHLSNMAMAELLKDMGVTDATVHGFRSSFRDWVHAKTRFEREIAEEALAHIVGNQTELAYRREDALERRRELMEAWARYLAPPVANVVTLRPKASG